MTVIETSAAVEADGTPAPRAFAGTLSGAVPSGNSTPERVINLYLLDDLEEVGRTSKLEGSDRNALHAVADWIRTFVARPHKDLGRPGPVCPFVPQARERNILWLAAEKIAGGSVDDVVELVNAYKKWFLDTHPVESDIASCGSLVIVFTDLVTDRAKSLLDAVLQRVAVASYVEDGLVMGGFYETNEASSIYNPSFRPFTPPVPFLLMRHAVVSDWKFFMDNDDWLARWARRFGESAVQALANELRRLPWRARRDEFDGFKSQSDNP
jgi:hypothetical protein